MPAARSTLLKLVERTCPKAADFYDANVPYDRDVFHAGVAAHAILEGLQKAAQHKRAALNPGEVEALVDSIARNLVTGGRSFDMIPEPPLPPDAVRDGRELAVAWWDYTQGATPLDWKAEHGLGVDENWRPLPYAKATYYKGILDLVGIIEAEGYEGYCPVGLVVTDYKTAWSTSAAELDTIQLRGQALLALAHAESLGLHNPDFIRRRVVNLRTRRAFEADLFLSDDGSDAVLDGWRKDIALSIAHANTRQAAPGAGCVGCPYVLVCDDAKAWLQGSTGYTDPRDLAVAYAVAQGQRGHLNGLVKEAAANGAITVPGGSVGFKVVDKRMVKASATDTLLSEWFGISGSALAEWKAEHETTVSLVKAIKVGVSGLGNVSKVLYPGRGAGKVEGFKEAREEFLARMVDKVGAAKFGIHKDVADEQEFEDGEEEE